MKSMQNKKSPGNDGLKKGFYEKCWNELKQTFAEYVSDSKEKGHLSTSQRHVIIKLIEKKIEIRDSYKIGGAISLLNVYLNIISKALSEKLKKVLPDLFFLPQTAYVITEIAKIKR